MPFDTPPNKRHPSAPLPVLGPVTPDFPTPDRSGSIVSVSRRGFHRIAYVEYGDLHSDRVAVCVHGLSRQGRDFDLLAQSLANDGWRVVCPDLVGRGRSDWLKDPEEYNLPQYAMDLTVLIARLDIPTVTWIGTSLGGLVGMVIAGQPGSTIERLVINDIGPFIPWQALHRLANNVRTNPRTFPDLAVAVESYRTTLAPFGKLSNDQWLHLARHGLKREIDGTWRKLADPQLITAFKPGWFFNLSLWTYWDAITCPTLVLRGTTSDLLLETTAAEMTRRGPKARLLEIPDCGHAPALLEPYQIGLIRDWLALT